MQEKLKQYWPTWLAMIIFSLFYIVEFRNTTTIRILNDEFGYWGNAATLVGLDWHSLLAQTGYYSMGLSFFLAPLFKLGIEPSAMYQLAILLNVIFMIVCYFCAYYSVKKLFPSLNSIYHQLISAVTVCSASCLIYTQYTMCETLLIMLYWCLIVLLVMIEEKFSFLKAMGICILSIALYLTHQRTLVIMGCAMLMAFIYTFKSKRYVCLFIEIIFCITGMLLYRKLHNYQIADVFNSTGGAIRNSVEPSASFVGGYIKKVFAYPKEFILSFVCKLGIVSLSTFFTLLPVCKGVFLDIGRKQYKHIGTKIFILLSALIMLGLNSIQMMHSNMRADIVIYSRYMDYVIPCVTLLGLAYCVQNPMGFKKSYLFSAIATVPILCLATWKTYSARETFIFICSPIWGAVLTYFDYDYITAGMIIIEVCFAVVVAYNSLIHRRFKYGRVAMLLIFLLISLATFRFGFDMSNTQVRRVHNNVRGVLDSLKEVPELDIYYLSNQPDDLPVKEIQFFLPDRPIKVVDRMDKIDANTYLLLSDHDRFNFSDYGKLATNSRLDLFLID